MAKKPPPDPLDTLSGMVNGVLIQVGHFFRDPQGRGEQTKTVIAGAHRAFDEALDQLQVQIFEAKALYERDLAEVRTIRASEATPPPTAETILKNDGDLAAKAGDNEGTVDATEQPTAAASADVLMGDEPTQVEARDQHATDLFFDEPEKATQRTGTADGGDAVGEGQPTGEGKSAPSGTEPSSGERKDKHDEKVEQKGPGEEAPLSAAMSQDINFESMFDEPPGDDAGGDMANDLNFDIDIGPSDLPAGDLTGNDTFNSTLTTDGATKEGDTTNYNSLLPGLESYANATGDDFGMMDFTQPTSKGEGNGAIKNAFDDLPELGGANAFDELIGDGTLGETMGEGMDDLFEDSLMELGELDDSWLKDGQ